MLRCIYCGERVDLDSGYRQVAGWERLKRPPSDTKAFHAPRKLERFACPDCVRKLTLGIDPRQEALV
jgi:DNA-directed RNA polymerase subunit RPC12/RpoP